MIWPPEYLFWALRNARMLGIRFEAVWPVAIEDAAGMSDEPDEWEVAFWETRWAWEAAFARMPLTRAQAALQMAGADLEVEEVRSDRRCVECGHWIPPDRDPEQGRAEYCSDACRRRVERRRAGRKVPPPRRFTLGDGEPGWLEWEAGRSLLLTVSRSQRPRNRS